MSPQRRSTHDHGAGGASLPAVNHRHPFVQPLPGDHPHPPPPPPPQGDVEYAFPAAPSPDDDEHVHYSHRAPWLRAVVLGANDGLVSTASLMLGVAGGE